MNQLELLHEDLLWFDVDRTTRLLHICSPRALEKVTAGILLKHASQVFPPEPYFVLESPCLTRDEGWCDRIQELSAAYASLREELPHLSMLAEPHSPVRPTSQASLAQFLFYVQRLVEALKSDPRDGNTPASGLVLVFAPSEVESAADWNSALSLVFESREVADVRFIVLDFDVPISAPSRARFPTRPVSARPGSVVPQVPRYRASTTSAPVPAPPAEASSSPPSPTPVAYFVSSSPKPLPSSSPEPSIPPPSIPDPDFYIPTDSAGWASFGSQPPKSSSHPPAPSSPPRVQSSLPPLTPSIPAPSIPDPEFAIPSDSSGWVKYSSHAPAPPASPPIDTPRSQPARHSSGAPPTSSSRLAHRRLTAFCDLRFAPGFELDQVRAHLRALENQSAGVSSAVARSGGVGPDVAPPPRRRAGGLAATPSKPPASSHAADAAKQVELSLFRAALAQGEQRGPDAVRHQREALAQAQNAGMADESLVIGLGLGAHLLQAGSAKLAVERFRDVFEQARGRHRTDLMVQARLAEAGALLLLDKHDQAAQRYAEAGNLGAEKHAILAIEAYRMCGTLALSRGQEQAARQAWYRALEVAKLAPQEQRSLSSAANAARQLAAYFRSQKLLPQAESLEQQAKSLEEPSALAVQTPPGGGSSIAANNTTKPGGS